MKLLKQKTLYFSEGKSDKVYEVDLCESSADLFIVNFRYGRRGANLREGTKTVFPVTYDEAITIYDKLILSKEKKGYSETGVVQKQITKQNTIKTEINSAREKTILKYLEQAVFGNYQRDWKVSRIIWKAGELNIIKSVQSVTHFIHSDDEFEQYAAIHTLAKLKDTSAIDTIYDIFNTYGFINKSARIAASFVLKFGNDTLKAKVSNRAFIELPDELKKSVTNSTDFLNSLAMYLLKESDVDATAFYKVYLFTYKNEELRNLLFKFIKNIPLIVNTFKSIRYIYRTAQITEDLRFLALISKRIAISKASYRSDYVYINNDWITTYEEKKKQNPSIAFSLKTKNYFNRNTYKYIYDLSKTNTDLYVDFVKELLVSLDDKIDNAVTDVQYTYDWNGEDYVTTKKYFPKYSDFLALMYVLYGDSNRLESTKTRWYYTQETDTNNLPREEALSQIWNTKPNEVLYILANAKSDVAIQFSLRIIQDNPQFLETISDELLLKLIGHYDSRVLAIIIDVLEQKYTNTKPEDSIIITLLKSTNEKAKSLAMQWLKKYESDYFSSSNFIAELLFTQNEDVIHYLSNLFKDEVKYDTKLGIHHLDNFITNPNQFDIAYIVLVNNLIGDTFFGKLFNDVIITEIKSLANSSSFTNKLFAVNLSKHNKTPAYQLFKDDFDSYINSDNEILRKAGISLLAHFPDEFLLKNHIQIGKYCFSEYAEVREAIQPSIERLIKLDAKFKEHLLHQLIQTIVEKENYEGTHQDSYDLLIKFYDKKLPSITNNSIIELVMSKYEFAQKLGIPLFNSRIDLKTLKTSKIATLTKSDILELRNAILQFFKENVDRINTELEDALAVFNSDWDDVITWARAYFEEYIKPENWTIDILLFIADHTKKEVQSFGRNMITKHFSEDKGLPLLLKLQEHPTKDMQFFVSNYLNNYAKGNVAVILKLKDYFKTSLFNINTHRATKIRIYSFLETESIANKEVAKMTIELINAVLGTKTLRDSSKNIDVLLTINEAHPELEIPLLIKST